MRITTLIPFLLLCGCDAPTQTNSDVPPEFLRAEVVGAERDLFDVTVALRNPSRNITTERYAACVIAGFARDRNDVWITRLRGTRRIQGALEELEVRYRLDRIDEPKEGDVFTAALVSRVCELEDIPMDTRTEVYVQIPQAEPEPLPVNPTRVEDLTPQTPGPDGQFP